MKGYYSDRGSVLFQTWSSWSDPCTHGERYHFAVGTSQWCLLSGWLYLYGLRSNFEGEIYFKWGRIVTSRNSGASLKPFFFSKLSSLALKRKVIENEYDGRTEEYVARTHALKLDADSPRYAGRTQGYAGHS